MCSVFCQGTLSRGSMACANVDMDIYGAEETGGVDCQEAPRIWYYRPLEVIPERKGPLHDLLQKQPATFGVRTSDTLSTSFYCPLLPQSHPCSNGKCRLLNVQRCQYLHSCVQGLGGLCGLSYRATVITVFYSSEAKSRQT